MIKTFFALWGVVLLVGCAASTTQGLVDEQNWYGLGEQDGQRGLPQRSLSDLRTLASEAGETINANYLDYEQGYIHGIDAYCDPKHAYQLGLDGNPYMGVCESRPGSQRFRMEWQRGYNDFQSQANGLFY
ncbi:DUF2799 domain-containing protein [Salinivibrio sp. VYel9]|uniref:DUF2799 domain-containing protein n=1 Tax=Salinivibrio siamensis TaxID=414286 RepID=A0ABX3KFY7_9GAMM|nr:MULTISPECIES: DUF2799 domain-containing protein [Salinivibrio]KKA45472.1 hypothetical protein WN56_05880 [Salinivibrio sp. KP-1]MPS32192.1 DUF2799 domain-containing protein [Salinivibrio sp. VYel7]MPX89939.1 DUF2799 domain-containing protein [Salinivibrio sp. VYel1]MPX93586.1 DUF2799 domain-containing protein [Salinivibrio sp. VYel9]MPX96418.1 DUF2799 domain-containing protein [Salinivibrio sp. VYel6]